jgi:hypothetical protein
LKNYNQSDPEEKPQKKKEYNIGSIRTLSSWWSYVATHSFDFTVHSFTKPSAPETLIEVIKHAIKM